MPFLENPYDATGYDMATLTSGINLLPNNYGRYQQMGLFAAEPVNTRVIGIDEVGGTLTILPSLQPGSPATEAKHDKAKRRFAQIPHVPHTDRITAEDLQGALLPGGYNLAMLNDVMMRRQTRMRNNHAITLEYMMACALQGIIYDWDGSTVIENLFTTFDISQKVVDFKFTVTTTAIPQFLRQVKRHIEDNLRGDVMSGINCDCSEEWMDAFLEHPAVKEVFLGHQAALQKAGIGADPRVNFVFAGITFNEYRAAAPGKNGSLRFIPANTAIFYPTGTMETFKLHLAPANRIDTANQLGQPLYSWQTMEPNMRWVDLYTESNPLPICRRPGVLVKGTMS
jgi:hypothetical protein